MDPGSNFAPEGIAQYKPRAAFVDFHVRDKRWAVMVCHRRAGKTVACVADLILAAVADETRSGRFAYIAPQFNQAKDIAWAYLTGLTKDIPGMGYNVQELRADFPNGSRIRLYGADNPDRLRGIYLDGVILDEFADMKPRVWGEVVRATLADRGGWAVFIGTPKGKNEFWKIWHDADERWLKLRLTADDSGILSRDELEDSRRTMTPDQFEQEYLCSFEAAIIGAYYGRELRELDRRGQITEVPHDPAVPVFTAWDLGYSDDTAIWWFQVVRDEIHVLECYSASGLSIADYAAVILQRGEAKGYEYARHWLPHDARAKTLASGGKSIVEQLAAHLSVNTLAIVPGLSLQDGVQAVRMTLPKCWFDAGCEDGLEALRQYQREWDEDKKVFRERPRHDWTSHFADAFRMLAIAWKQPAAPPPPPPDVAELLSRKPTFNEVFWAEEKRRRTRI